MRNLLILIVVFLAASDILGMDVGLAPGLSMKNGLLYLALGLLLLQRAVTRRPKMELAWLQIVFVCLVIYAIGSVVFNIMVLELSGYRVMDQIVTLKTQLIDRLIIFALFFYLTRTEADVRVVLSWLLLAIAVGCVLTITNVAGLTSIGRTIYGSDNEVEGGRVFGYFGHANETGTLLVALIPAYIAMSERARGWARAGWMACLAAVALMLLMTGSRGAMVGLLTGGLGVVIVCRRHFEGRRVRRWLLWSVPVLVPVVLIFGWQYVQTLAERVAIQASGQIADASSGRTEIWGDALGAMLDSPWTLVTGFGWGGWDNHNFRYVAHNSYLSYWFDLGLPGLLALLMLILGTMLVARRAIVHAAPGTRGLLIAYLAGMASLLVAIAFLNLYTPWPYLWAYIGLMMRMATIVGAGAPAAAPVRAPLGTQLDLAPPPSVLRRT